MEVDENKRVAVTVLACTGDGRYARARRAFMYLPTRYLGSSLSFGRRSASKSRLTQPWRPDRVPIRDSVIENDSLDVPKLFYPLDSASFSTSLLQLPEVCVNLQLAQE